MTPSTTLWCGKWNLVSDASEAGCASLGVFVHCSDSDTAAWWMQSYTPDACMSTLTSQQLLRVGSAWTNYRARYQLKPLPLPGSPLLRLAPSPPPPPVKKKPVAPVAKPKTASAPAKLVTAAARMAPKKVTKPPVKRAAG